MIRARARLVLSSLFISSLCVPVPAAAQFYAAAYLGGNHTQRADVHVDQSSADTVLAFHNVSFAAHPLESPQYYGVRIGRLLGGARHYGLEVEFIHLKVISDTDRTFRVTGRIAGQTVDTDMRMDTLVERYAMTHGLNFLLINAVTRRPVGDGRLTLTGRVGAGPTYPHAESRIGGVPLEQYEYAGIGAHAAAGVDLRLGHGLSALLEYKFTVARPEISVPSGRGHVRTLTHQVAAGLAFGLSH